MKKNNKKTSINSRRILELMASATVGAFRNSGWAGKPCAPPAPTRDWKPCHSISHSPFFSHFPEEPWWFPAGNKSADLFPHIPHWSRTTGPAASSQCGRAGFISVITCKHGCCLPEGPRPQWPSASIGQQGRCEERTLFNRQLVWRGSMHTGRAFALTKISP